MTGTAAFLPADLFTAEALRAPARRPPRCSLAAKHGIARAVLG
jgi:hypothetical protein